jgi:hypothetical protein
MVKESKALQLMGIASDKLESGANLTAMQLYGTAARFNFEDQRHARLGYAIAKGRCFMFSEAIDELEALLGDKEVTPENTVFRADVLRCLCEVLVATSQLENIAPLLKEAAEIYKYQGVLAPLGAIVQLQGYVAGAQDRLDEAADKIEWGVRYAKINFPGIVPFSIGIDRPTDLYGREVSLAEPAFVSG